MVVMAADRPEQKIAQTAPACHCNGKPMRVAYVVPKAGPLPELCSFRCEHCGHVETVEVNA